MKLTTDLIENLNYVEFISLLQETNRCPGGKNTIRWIAQNSFISESSSVLEIGANTGFTSFEFARTVGCKCVGIDVEGSAIEVANQVLTNDTENIQKLVQFKNASAYDVPFDDNSFDLVVAGGATSFMDNKKKAVSEYYRVLKPWGFLSITNLYYAETPPQRLLDDLKNILEVEIQPWGYEDWMNVINNEDNFEVYLTKKNVMRSREHKDIEQYVNYFMRKPHIAKLDNDVKKAIYDRWMKIISTFNENHNYLGFFSTLLRKNHLEEEPELFTNYKSVE